MRTRLQTVYFPVLWHIYFQSYAFWWWNPFTCQCKTEKTKRLWGFKFRSFIGRSVKWYRGSEGVKSGLMLALKRDGVTRPCTDSLYTKTMDVCKSMPAHTDWNDLMLPYIVLYIYKSLDRKQPDCTHTLTETTRCPCMATLVDYHDVTWQEPELTKQACTNTVTVSDWSHPMLATPPAAWLTCKSRVVSNWILTSCQPHKVTSG